MTSLRDNIMCVLMKRSANNSGAVIMLQMQCWVLDMIFLKTGSLLSHCGVMAALCCSSIDVVSRNSEHTF
jgi:hypothetical protein